MMSIMAYIQPTRYLPSHPLAGKNGKVKVSRMVLHEKLGGVAAPCHWCGCALTWETLCADHLDSDTLNNVPENLVASCRGCNANRDDGTGHGRRPPDPPCEHCGGPIGPYKNRKPRRFCSIRCANLARAPYGTTRPHGTIGRYQYGCRCGECSAVQAAYDHERWLRNHPPTSPSSNSAI